MFVHFDKDLLDSSFIYGGDVLLKGFVKFRRILVADEARLRCDLGDSSVETVVKFRMGV